MSRKELERWIEEVETEGLAREASRMSILYPAGRDFP